jgi:hypothetical protein
LIAINLDLSRTADRTKRNEGDENEMKDRKIAEAFRDGVTVELRAKKDAKQNETYYVLCRFSSRKQATIFEKTARAMFLAFVYIFIGFDAEVKEWKTKS